MNAQNVKQLMPILQAFAEGKQIQLRCGFNWMDCDDFDFKCAPSDYRIKPTPTLRPWRPEEVPVGALIKVKELKYLDGLHIQMLLYVCPQGVTLSARNGTIECKLNELANIYEHSLDHGKTWLPCGVVE